VSSLWTPGGEVPVPPRSPGAGGNAKGGPGDDDELDPEELAETEAAIRAEMDKARAQLAAVPAADVVANHVMGLYELAAIHLLQQPPHFADATLAIDAMGAVVEGLEGRLGQHESTCRDALAQIRLAFVQVKGNASSS
jgi:hypothetical protein